MPARDAQSGGEHSSTSDITLNNIRITWDLDAGTLAFQGDSAATFRLTASLLPVLAPLRDELGTELFRLLIAHQASLGAEEDYRRMVEPGRGFEEGFATWAEAVAAAGWGRIELVAFDPDAKTARVHVRNPWELQMQTGHPDPWGCPFLQGKIIGIFNRAFGRTCWADEEHLVTDGPETAVELVVSPSERTVQAELARLRLERAVAREQALADEVARKTAQLRRLEEELFRVKQFESLGVLAGGLAHDFNNLLTTILGNVTLADRRAAKRAPVRDLLREARDACEEARGITQQLLAFARGGPTTREAVDPAELVRASAGFALRGSRSRCEFDLAPNLPPIEVDRGGIGRVIHNLVLNAAQAMPDGGTVRVAARPVTEPRPQAPTAPAEAAADPGLHVEISIADEGVGIPPDELERIFEPYYTTKQNGSGLGLAGARGLVARHGGDLRVESAPGEGTTFYLYLPVSQVQPDPAPRPRGLAPTGGGRVLVLDDEASICRLTVKLLASLGYAAVAVHDGEEAVRRFEAARAEGKPFDLVLLDLTIPGGMGGLATLVELRRIDPAVRAVVSSGYSNDPVLRDPQRYGFQGVVPKPYQLNQLADVLADVLHPDALAR